MKTIDELWYGNISPFEQCTRGDKRLKELLKLVARNREELEETLTEKQKETLEKFEDCMNQLAEYDPKTYATIYKDLMKHMIPKQSEVSVTHGLDEDFKQLAALSMTKVGENNEIDVSKVPEIKDADFEELQSLADGDS